MVVLYSQINCLEGAFEALYLLNGGRGEKGRP